MAQLVVTAPFGSYGRGARITDAGTIAAILSGPNHIYVVQVADDPGSGGTVTPLLPNAIVPVVGTPDPALGATYGYALDLTSTPATLYKWTGAVWSIALQAGSGSGTAPAVPVNTALPAISGTAQVGQTLTVSPGTWSGAPTSYAYQWRSNGAAITGATAASYIPAAGDIGAVLTCAITASNAAGASTPAVSTGTSAVVAAPVTAPGPIAAAPTLSAAATASLTFAWLAPTAGGAPSDYLVDYKLSSASTWTTVDESSTALSAMISGLAAATSYDIRVRASNGAGQGAVSPVLTVSTAAAPPVQPAGIAADANDATITTLL